MSPGLRAFIATLVSAMMVLQAPFAFAGNKVAGTQATQETKAGDATDGVPVAFHSFSVQGRQAYVVMAAVPSELEDTTVQSVVSQSAETTILQVKDEDDPALKSAAKTGRLNKVKTFFSPSSPESPLFQIKELSSRTKQTLLDKMNAVTSTVKEKKWFLMLAAAYSGINASYVYLSSSSVEAGVATMSALFLWNALIIAKPEFWNAILKKGGSAFTRLGSNIASLFGREMTQLENRFWDTTGKFATSLAFNTVQAFGIQMGAGAVGPAAGLGYVESLAQAAYSGTQNNYNIWDAYVLDRLSSAGASRYMALQWIVGGAFEVAAYQNISLIPLTMLAVTASGFLFLLLHPERQAKLERSAIKFNGALRYGATVMSSKEERLNLTRQWKASCAQYLAPKPPPKRLNASIVWEDIQ